jgi:coniferyl-aldehyde dehydrogenase
LVAEEQNESFISQIIAEAQAQFPNPTQNGDHTAIINNTQYERLQRLIKDAVAKGAKVTIVDEGDGSENNKKMSLHILQGVSDDMAIMQEEIFGPILPIVTYKKFDEAITYLRGKDKPLASYYFGKKAEEESKVFDHVPSGATTVNDVLFHVLQSDLPFGGVGNSGMGSYHGVDGFNEFTNPRAIFKQGWFDVGKLVRPPYKDSHEKTLRKMM